VHEHVVGFGAAPLLRRITRGENRAVNVLASHAQTWHNRSSMGILR
jgi:hypothetical protein